MKSFNRLCPQCQRPLISDEMYCSWCNMYSPALRPETSTTFPPPPQYTDLSGQNWTQTDLPREFSGGKITPPQQSAPRRPNTPLLIGSILGICLLVMVSFVMGKNVGSPENKSPDTTTSVSIATSTQTPPTSVTTVPTANPTTPPLTLQPQAGIICEAGSTDSWKNWQVQGPWEFLPTDHKLLLQDGSSESTLTAPDFCQPKIPDYAVEAKIQRVKGGYQSAFGITVRGGYTGGIHDYAGDHRFIKAGTSYEYLCNNEGPAIDSGYHTYRVEARGNEIDLWIDGGKVCSSTDNQYLSPGTVGLYSNCQVAVTDFKVFPL